MKRRDWDNIAKNYHKEVISPFQEGVINPLFKNLEKVKNSRKMIVADIGCGTGETLNFLASRFKKVYAFDFSPIMIKLAREQSTKKNIEYYVKDMRNMEEFEKKFDVAVAVNSVIMPKLADIKKSLRSIYNSLKTGGTFYGIFPSMESILYQGFLILEDQLQKYKDGMKALKNTKKLLERSKYNFMTGFFNDNGQVQKFYYDFELRKRLHDAGFKKIKISKVLYPWEEKISGFENFPGKPMMWDWFVGAEK